VTAYFAVPTGTAVSLAPDPDYDGATSGPLTFRLDYRFIGLSQPVNDPPGSNQSVFKVGSTVPLKFQLGVAGTGLISDALAAAIASGGKATVSFQHTSAVTLQVDESLYTDTPTPGNTFRYDATGRQFIYNWGTKGLATGNWTVTVTVKRQDGTSFTHSVVVGLR
jgi:hypothetical protein